MIEDIQTTTQLISDLEIQIIKTDIKVMISILSTVATAIIAFITFNFTKKTFLYEKESKRKEKIRLQLTEFYGPLLTYLNISNTLYRIFKTNKPAELHLLPHLLDPLQSYNGVKVTLNESDHEIIKEIIDISNKIEKLITEKTGLVDAEELRFKNKGKDEVDYISILLIHFKVVKMAYEKKFSNTEYNIDKLKNFTFPEEIKDKIDDIIKNLQKELNK